MKYRLIIYGNEMYKETTLNDRFSGSLTIGTDKSCQIAFKKEDFLVDFVVHIDRRDDGQFMISCSESIYLQKDISLREYVRPLSVGDHISLNYEINDTEFLIIDFLPIYDRIGNDFDQVIETNDLVEFSIGGQVDSIIRVDDPVLVNESIRLRKALGGYEVDLSESPLGVEINGFPSRKDVGFVKYGEFINIRGYSFCIDDGVVYVTKNANIISDLRITTVSYQDNHFIYPKFVKNVRQLFKMPDDKPEVLAPKAKQDVEEQSFLLKIAPMFISMLLMVGLRGIMGGGGVFVIYFASTMLVSMIVTIINFVKDKKKREEREEKRRKVYMDYLSKREDEIIKLREREQKLANYMNPKLNDYIHYIDSFSDRLFEKKKEHEDYLKVRLGEGTVVSSCPVEYKKEEYVDKDDELKDFPEALHDKYKYISAMPVCLDLKDKNAVGFIGNRTKLYQIEKNLIVEFASSHFYNDVKLFLIIDKEDIQLFSWARWLKSTYNEFNKMRNFMYDAESAKYTLEFLYSELSRRESNKNEIKELPEYIVMVFRSQYISNHPVSQYIEKAKDLGFHFVFFEEYPEFTNEYCSEIIYLNDDDNTGYVQNTNDGEDIQYFTYEHVSKERVEKAAKKLASVYVDEVNLENSLTKSISLYDMLGIMSPYDLNLGNKWNNSRVYESMAAPIGVKSGGELVYLDIHEKNHGPHGLVAGTTGSGKSELLQSYILSMATLYHPYEVGFIIIDFKGGGMANQFRQLPHLNGAITNIDGNEIERSLLSIKAELLKRQELFAEYEVNHIDDYIKCFKEGRTTIPLPHLILIVDEFAELKSEYPDFMKELISASRIGRSLGVHLILATQKPSGVISEQIWSNSRFKLCLKVQNKNDSNEVLKSPLAAEIREPGRAYFQVGNNELFQLFQSAYSGAASKTVGITGQKTYKISRVDLAGRRKVIYEQKPKVDEASETQLKAIVNYINEYCDNNNIQKLPDICLPPLRDYIPFTNHGFENTSTDIQVPIGITDDPARQNQHIEIFNLSQDNFFILGSSQTGKTNLIETIIRGLTENYTPKDVNIYILDYASMVLKNFENLNHVGGVIISTEEDKLKSFIKLMFETIQNRKRLFAKLGISSYSAYREAGNDDIPQIIVFLDNWIAFRNYSADYEESIIELCRDSVSAGISFVVTTAQGGGIGFKLLANFSKRTALYCNDSSDYGIIFDSCRKKLPNIQGRSFVEKDKKIFECQYYIAFAAAKEYEKINLMKEFIEDINSKYDGLYVRHIPEIPEHVTETYLEKQFGNRYDAYEVPLGMEYDSIDKRTLKLDKIFMSAIIEEGDENYNKSYVDYLLNRMLLNKEQAPLELYMVDNNVGEYKEFKSSCSGYTTSFEGAKDLCSGILEKLKQREEKLSNPQFDISKEPLLLMIFNSKGIVRSSGDDKEFNAVLSEIIENYKSLKVCFLITDVNNEPISFKDGALLKYIKNNKDIISFIDLSGIKFIDIPLAALRVFKKPLNAYEAYHYSGETIEKIKVLEKA